MIFLSSFCGTELKPGKLSRSADGAAPAVTVSAAALGYAGSLDFLALPAGGREKTGSDDSVPVKGASREVTGCKTAQPAHATWADLR